MGKIYYGKNIWEKYIITNITAENFVKSKYILIFEEPFMAAEDGWKRYTEDNQIQKIRLKLVKKYYS